MSEWVKSLSRVRLFATPWTAWSTRLLCPWDFPGKSTGVGCHFLIQGIFLTQGLNPGLPRCRQTLYCLSRQGRITPNIWIKQSLVSHPWYLITLACLQQEPCYLVLASTSHLDVFLLVIFHPLTPSFCLLTINPDFVLAIFKLSPIYLPDFRSLDNKSLNNYRSSPK